MAENTGWQKRFYSFVGGQAVSLVGSSAVNFAIIFWLAFNTGSPLVMSIAGMFAFLPQFLLGPFAGVWIDRLKRKNVVIVADMSMGVVSALFALSFLWGEPSIWLACAVLGIRSIGNVFDVPAVNAIVPMMVPKTQLMRANGVMQMIQSAAFILGPALGAAMLSIWSLPAVLITDLIGAMIACGIILLIRVPELSRSEISQQHFLTDIKIAIEAIWQDRALRSTLIFFAVCLVFFMPLGSFHPLMVTDVMQGGEWHLMATELFFTAGMMATAGLAAGLGSKLKRPLVLVKVGLLLMGVAAASWSFLGPGTAGFAILLATCALMGGAMNLGSIPLMTYMQANLAKNLQGRVMSLTSSLMSGAMLGLVFAGPIAQWLGVSVWFGIAGGIIIVISVASLMMQFRLDKV